MKKIKLLSFLTVVGTMAPVIALTSCSNGGGTTDVKIELTQDDKDYLNSINAVIKPLDFEGVPFKAVHAVKNAGYNLFEHKFSNLKFELVLNMDKKQYCILCDDVIYTPDEKITEFDKNIVWKFVDKYDPTSQYAQHLNDNFKWDSNETLEVTGCLDTGTNTNVKRIKYVGTSTQKICYLRTYTEFLIIEPQANDTIHHYHYADNVYLHGTGSSHYNEYGRSGYMQAKNTKVSFVLTKAKDEPSTIDVFEAIDDNVEIVNHHEGANVYTKVNGHETIGDLETVYKAIDAVSVDSIEKLDAINKNCLVRLANDIEVKDKRSSHWTLGSTSVELNIVLDLNGHSIITPEKSEDTTLITIKNGTLILLDTVGQDSTGAIKGSQSIAIESINETGVARFIIDGGSIDFNSSVEENRSAIYVGEMRTTGSELNYKSQFYMYGGSINATNKSSSNKASVSAIQMLNQSSYAYFVFGTVYGSQGAVITDDASKGSSLDTQGSEIEVFGGDFKSDDDQICINLRRHSTFIVYGGSFRGGTCVGAINSNVILNGGYFVANGSVVEDFYKQKDESIYKYNNYLVADGSVIAAYWHTDNQLPSTSEGYTAQPRIVSNNVKMYSNKGNIFHIGSEKDLFPENIGKDKSWLEFISGCYYFNGSVQKEGSPFAMLVDSASTYEKFEWLQKGLWNNIPL